MDRKTKAEMEQLQTRYSELGETIEGLLEAISRGSTSSEELLAAGLSKARKELDLIVQRLHELKRKAV